jgi:hypothetical protein
VAQLEARLDGIEEVEGSNPFGSTKLISDFQRTALSLAREVKGRGEHRSSRDH